MLENQFLIFSPSDLPNAFRAIRNQNSSVRENTGNGLIRRRKTKRADHRTLCGVQTTGLGYSRQIGSWSLRYVVRVPVPITLKRELCRPVPANRVFIKRRPTRPGRRARTSRRIRPKEEPRAEDSYRGRSARGQLVGVGYRAGTGVGGGGNATAVVGTEPTLRRSFSLTRLPGRGIKPRQITRRNEINPNRTGRTCGLLI